MKKAFNKKKKIDWHEKSVYIAFIVSFIVFTITLKDVGTGFANISNLMNILRQTCLLAIMSVGMTFVISCGQIDLSAGNMVGVVSVLTAMTLNKYGVVVALTVGLLFGILAGLFNGLLIAVFKIPPFVATLGTSMLWQGASRRISNLKAITIINEKFIYYFGGGNVAGVPIVLLWMIVFAALGFIIMYKTGYGRKVLAVGGNETSAMYSGIDIFKIRVSVMVIMGLLAAVAGILWTGRFGGGRYSLGETSGTDVIAATVLGGTLMSGGTASILGSIVGSLFIGMLNNALVMYGLDTHQQMMVSGLTILLAVAVTVRKDRTNI